MRSIYVLTVAGLALSLLLASVAGAASTPLLTTSLTAGTPVQTTIGGSPAVRIDYTNTLSTSMLVIAYLTVQNSLGQTVEVSVATANMNSGGTLPVYLVMYGLPSGHYTADVFATTGGVPVSTVSSLSVTL